MEDLRFKRKETEVHCLKTLPKFYENIMGRVYERRTNKWQGKE